MVRQGKGDAACQAEQSFEVGMTMGFINLPRIIRPSSGIQSTGLKKGKYLGFRQ
jgi:hypothetical protein